MDKVRVQKEKDKGSGVGTENGSRSRGNLTWQPLYGELFPAPNKDCRICKQLEKQRGQTNLFLNHLGKFVHGCPKFTALSQEERMKVCKEAQVCLVCISPKVAFTPAHITDCSIQSEGN